MNPNNKIKVGGDGDEEDTSSTLSSITTPSTILPPPAPLLQSTDIIQEEQPSPPSSSTSSNEDEHHMNDEHISGIDDALPPSRSSRLSPPPQHQERRQEAVLSSNRDKHNVDNVVDDVSPPSQPTTAQHKEPTIAVVPPQEQQSTSTNNTVVRQGDSDIMRAAEDPSSIDCVNGAASGVSPSNNIVVRQGDSAIMRAALGSDSTATQPGVLFVSGPGFDNDYGIRTGYRTPVRGSLGTVNNEDAAVNSDIENQTTLIEAYTVPDDDEQAEMIGHLQERLGSTRHELEVARSQLAAPVVEGVHISDDEQGTKKKRLTIGALVLFLGAIAVGVGLAVFFANNTGGNDDDEPPEVAAVQVFPPVLDALKERKFLRCGIYDRYGFSSINEETNEREGFEIDLCKAIAAAALGSSYRYELVQTTGANRFVKLANGEFDVLISGTTYTFDRDVHESSSGIGFSFSTPYLYGVCV